DLTPGVGYTLYLTVANLAGELTGITRLMAQTALPQLTAPTDTVYLVKDVAYDDTVDAADNAMPDTPAQFIDPRYVDNNAPTGVIDECTLTAVDGQAPDPINPLRQLPLGVSLEVLDTGIGCAFTGTPTIFTPSREYTFTATDDSEVGSAPVSVRIKVIEREAPDLQPLALIPLILEQNRDYAEASDAMPDATPAVRFVNRGGPPGSCTGIEKITSLRGRFAGFTTMVSGDGETCVIVSTPDVEPKIIHLLAYVVTATTEINSIDVTDSEELKIHIAAPLPIGTTLAPADEDGFDANNPENSGSLKTLYTFGGGDDATASIFLFAGSRTGLRFNNRVTACSLAPDSPRLPSGLSLHVNSGLRLCSLNNNGETRTAADVNEYTIVGSHGDQSATRKLRLEVIEGNFTSPELSVAYPSGSTANTITINTSDTPVAIPFANAGSKISSTFVGDCKLSSGSNPLPGDFTVRLATLEDQNAGIADEGNTCILAGTPSTNTTAPVMVEMSYPSGLPTNGLTIMLDTITFTIEVAPTPVLVAPDRPVIMEQDNPYTTANPAAILTNTGLELDSCAIEFVPFTNKAGQVHSSLISEDLAAEAMGNTCVITGTVTGKTFSFPDLQATYRVTATATGESGEADRIGTAEIKMSVFTPVDDSEMNPIAFQEDSTLRTVYTEQTFGSRGNGFPGFNFRNLGVRIPGFTTPVVSSCALASGSAALPPSLSLHIGSDRARCVIYVDPDKSLRQALPPTEYTIVGQNGDHTDTDSGTLRIEIIEGPYTPPALSIAYPAGGAANTIVIESTTTPVNIPFNNAGSKLSTLFGSDCMLSGSSNQLPSGFTVRLATIEDQNAGIADEGSTCILAGTPTELVAPTTVRLVYGQTPGKFSGESLQFTFSIVAPQ
ncbi:MAG: hypothetical protein K0U66_01220, partial [Gammaproteobacteria bacterium]|nr:hypothetical protein [Gammaproteobacteria bacterium]